MNDYTDKIIRKTIRFLCITNDKNKYIIINELLFILF